MSKAHDELLAIGFVNSWHLVTKALAARIGPGIYIAHRHHTATRDWRTPGWTIANVTDRSRTRHFPVTARADRGAQRQVAIETANREYGTHEWTTIAGLGADLFPAEVVEWASAKLHVARERTVVRV